MSRQQAKRFERLTEGLRKAASAAAALAREEDSRTHDEIAVRESIRADVLRDVSTQLSMRDKTIAELRGELRALTERVGPA